MELEKFKEYCKTITRKDFLEDCEENSFSEYEIDCPDEVGLLRDCSKKCLDCWQNAVKDIKFKGEKEMDNKSVKTYKTWEVYKMLTENPTLKFKDEFGYCLMVVGKEFVMKYGEEDEDVVYNSIDDKWALVQNPVDFMTAVKSGKKIKCKHEKLYGDEDLGYKYNSLASVLYFLQSHYVSEEIVNILTEGKFYIQEDV